MRRSRGLDVVGLIAVCAVAVALRVWPWFTSHTFGGVLEYDDGVYYAASRALAHGLLPYRDFVIVHPPLGTVLFLPFAGLGAWFGDPVGMEAARVTIVVVGVVNAVLLYRTVRDLLPDSSLAPIGGLIAAASYAVFPGAVAAEHTLLLEPVVNLIVLLASRCLLRPGAITTGRAAGAGTLLAAAISVKAFAAVYLIVALIALLAVRDWRTLRRLLAGVVAGVVVFVGPFFLAAPHRFWTDVVATQWQRPSDGGRSGWNRLVDMLGFGPLTLALAALGVAVLAAAAVAFAQSTGRLAAVFWLGTAAAFVVAFLQSPSYFTHYAGVLAPPLAVVGGASIGVLDRPPIRLRAASLAIAAAMTGMFLSASLTPLAQWRGQGDFAAASRLIPRGACVYTDAVSLTIATDRFRPPSRDCPTWIDGRGVNLTLNRHWPASRPFYPDGFLADAAWQRANFAQLEAADVLLIRGTTAEVPEWTQPARDYVTAHFREVWQAGGRAPASVWLRR